MSDADARGERIDVREYSDVGGVRGVSPSEADAIVSALNEGGRSRIVLRVAQWLLEDKDFGSESIYRRTVCGTIQAESEKAYRIGTQADGRARENWVPKSQVTVFQRTSVDEISTPGTTLGDFGGSE